MLLYVMKQASLISFDILSRPSIKKNVSDRSGLVPRCHCLDRCGKLWLFVADVRDLTLGASEDVLQSEGGIIVSPICPQVSEEVRALFNENMQCQTLHIILFPQTTLIIMQFVCEMTKKNELLIRQFFLKL
jgi:hypothetical protein